MSTLPIDPTGGVAKEMYKDLLSPSAKLIGETIADVVRLVLRPVQDRIDAKKAVYEGLTERIARRVVDVPPGRRLPVPTVIGGPVFEAALFASDEPVLQEMYAALLATAMDADTAQRAHPAFVEIIRQLTPDEARLVALCATSTLFTAHRIGVDGSMWGGPSRERVVVPFFSLIGLEVALAAPAQTSSYLDNLVRLGLLRRTDYEDRGTYVPSTDPNDLAASVIDRSVRQTTCEIDSAVKETAAGDLVSVLSLEVLEAGDRWFYKTWEYRITDFGRQFAFACVGPAGISD